MSAPASASLPANGFHAILLTLAPLLLSMAVMVLGNSLSGTLISIRLDLEGIAVDRIGQIMAAYSVGFVLGTTVCPQIVARVGHIRAFAAFAAIASGTALVHALVLDPLLWGVLRALSGFCMAVLFTITESWLNAKSPNALRGRVMSTYMTVYYFASGSSQYLLATLDPAGFQLFALVAITISLSLVPLALGRVETPSQIQSDRFGLRTLMQISPLGVAGCFGAGLIVGAFYALAPVYARGINPAPEWVAQFMMLAIFAGFALQYPVGRLSDRFDRRQVILGLTVASAIVSLAIAMAGGFSLWLLLTLVAIYSGLSLTLYPISLSHANDYLTPGQLVPASAGLLLCYGIGAIIGPTIAASAMRRVGDSGLFTYIATVSALLALFTLWRMTRRASIPNAAQGAYVAVPQTTSAVAELDPRHAPADDMVDDTQIAFDFDRRSPA